MTFTCTKINYLSSCIRILFVLKCLVVISAQMDDPNLQNHEVPYYRTFWPNQERPDDRDNYFDYNSNSNDANYRQFDHSYPQTYDSPYAEKQGHGVELENRDYLENYDQEPFVDDNDNYYYYYDHYYRPKPTEEAVQHEPAKAVVRSAIPWAVRDVRSRGQPRHIACNQPLDRGIGPEEISSWNYNADDHRCHWFGYQGYGGNANRFYSRTTCENLCAHDNEDLCKDVKCLWPTTQCSLVGDQSCKDYKIQRDKPWEAECPPDQPVCLSRRNTRVAPDIDSTNIPSECRQEANPGSCTIKNPSENYYYDVSRNDCMAFYFHECGGNDNRFQTKTECMTHCSP